MPKPLPPSNYSLADLFEFSCRRKPEDLAYAFVRDTLELDNQLTYGELERTVRSLAGHLARRVQPGTRALLLYPPGLDVVCAFWACMRAGLVPVPAPAPDPVRRKHSLPRLRAIIEDAQVSLVLTTSGIETISSELSIAKDGSQIEWMATDQPYDSRRCGRVAPSQRNRPCLFAIYIRIDGHSSWRHGQPWKCAVSLQGLESGRRSVGP